MVQAQAKTDGSRCRHGSPIAAQEEQSGSGPLVPTELDAAGELDSGLGAAIDSSIATVEEEALLRGLHALAVLARSECADEHQFAGLGKVLRFPPS